MKKAVYTLAALAILSASTVSLSAQGTPTPKAFSGSNPLPLSFAFSGSNPLPQSFIVTAYTVLLGYMGF